MDEVAAPGPFLDLHARYKTLQVVALLTRELPAEDGKRWHLDHGGDLLDPALQLVCVGSQQLVPVAEDDLGADLMRVERGGPQRIRDEVEAHAALKRGECVGEPGAAQ